MRETVRWAWRVKILTHLDTDLKNHLSEDVEEEAIKVFAHNLKDLLLAAPAGPRVTLGLDPGLRTGVKVAVVDATGKLVDTATIYPHVPQNRWDESLAVLAALVQKHKVQLISIGNGTASRETDRLAADLIKKCSGANLTKVLVSEAGASVYSASELAAREFPELDVSLRGAVSIARRLQEPLIRGVGGSSPPTATNFPPSAPCAQHRPRPDARRGRIVLEWPAGGSGTDRRTAPRPGS